MIKFRRFLVSFILVLFSVFLVACGRGDKEPPAMTVEKDTITHEQNVTIDFLEGVTVTDNLSELGNITIEVSDWGGYDKSKIGRYVITIKATDEAGNSDTTKITVYVIQASDKVAPMVNTSSITTINHLAGEDYDLTAGLTGVDNVDGTNVEFKVVDLAGYKKDVAGTYIVKIVAFDKAGNESAQFARTVVVANSYARAEMESFEGELIRYKALYNPQVFNAQTGTGYNTAYDGHYVNVLSKAYVEWLLEYAPERLGANVGWSVIAVTDANDKIVYVRHWNSGEAYHDEDGDLVSIKGNDWSTGTIFTWTETVGDVTVGRSNARYSSGEMGLMMANINQHIPADGHVFMFLNWTSIKDDGTGKAVLKPNEADMPRSMGANYIMNSDEDGDDVMDYAIGRELRILDPQLSDQVIRKSFDFTKPFPVISIPSTRFINQNGIWKNNYTEQVYLSDYDTENPYNPLRGVTANDGKGGDITSSITYKVYRYQTSELKYKLFPSIPVTDPLWEDFFEDTYKLSENEVILENALVSANDQVYFVVEYTVTANNQTDKAYRLIQVQAQKPDYLELYGESDTVFSSIYGLEQRLELNPDLDEFGSLTATDKGMIYDASTFATTSNLPVVPKGAVVVLDDKYNIQFIRISNGALFEIDAFGMVKKIDITMTHTDIIDGLDDIVPTGGYVVIYPQGQDDAVMNKALRALYDYDYAGGPITEIKDVKPVNGIVVVNLVIKEVQEVSTLIVNGEAPTITVGEDDVNIAVIENSKDSLIFKPAGGGAGFRLDTGKAYYYTKEMYSTLVTSTEVVDSFTTTSPNHGVPWFNAGVLVVLDADGNFYQARLAVGGPSQINADGTTIVGNAYAKAGTEAGQTAAGGENNLTWDVVIPNAANTKAHGPLMDILTVIPDGGSLFIFPVTPSTNAVRDFAIKLLWNDDYPGSGALVDKDADPVPENAATNGFDATTYNEAYFDAVELIVEFVATETAKAPKLVRPIITITGNTMTWNQITGAESYDVYVDGVLAIEGVGSLDEETGVYTFDLADLELLTGLYDIRLRAHPTDAELNSTSVLSDVVEYDCERLVSPENFVLEGDILSWDEIDGVTEYSVVVGDLEAVVVTTNSVQIPAEQLVNDIVVSVVAKGFGGTLDSVPATHILQVNEFVLTIGDTSFKFKEFTLDKWLTYADPAGGNDVGAANIAGLVIVNDLTGLADLADTTKLINGGYLAVVDSNMKVKYIATRWGQSWDATNGWKLNGGETEALQWAWGANLLASYVKPHIAAGDSLIMASQYSKGLSESNYRNLFANELMIDRTGEATDHRAVKTFEGVIDPSTVSIVYNEIIAVELAIGNTNLPYKEFTLAEWLTYADPAGGNDVGAANIAGLVIVNDLTGLADLADTTKLINGGYLAVVDSNMKVKYIATRWGQSWDATNGWKLNGGETETLQWAWGANLLASYVKPHIAAGDSLIMASQYSKGLSESNYRNLFGNELIKEISSGDHRVVKTFEDAIDPSTVSIGYKGVVGIATVIGDTNFSYKEFTLAEWLTYADPAGGNDVGAANIAGLVIVNDLTGLADLADTTKLINGGYLAVVDSNMKVKYIATRWGQSWDATNGWKLNGGETEALQWAWGANLLASYVKPHIAAGDSLIMASQYSKGLSESNYRNLFGNELIKEISSGDHRVVKTFEDAIDPSTVGVKIGAKVEYVGLDHLTN